MLDADKQKRVTIRWEHTKKTREFFGLCEALRSAGIQVEAVFEPSGTYGDAIRSGLQEAGFPVFRMEGKRVHDAQEVFDGVSRLFRNFRDIRPMKTGRSRGWDVVAVGSTNVAMR